LNKKQRRVLIAAAELAIVSLANNDREDYCGAAEAINAVRRQAGMKTSFMKAILEGVAEQAAELAGEKFEILDQVARIWLAEYFTPSEKLISITKGNTNGNSKEQA
jgi:Fic family protein